MSESINTLYQQLARSMKTDQFRLRRRLDRVRKLRDAELRDSKLQLIAAAIADSVARREQRRQRLPHPELQPQLPVSARGDDIREAIAANQVVVICGETGSGKTTQLPKICLQLGRGEAGLIGHTQPRRIAARSVATRIAEELGTPLGEQVGFKVRFRESLADSAFIKLMTDGILLSEIQSDRFLDAYDTLIIDEAHERSLNIDLLLGYIREILPRRPDLKVIITSATIDPQKFSRFFDCPILEVSGRSYPVETRYRPLPEQGEDKSDYDANLVRAVDELLAEGPGDILLFLYGENEIRYYHRLLHHRYGDRLELMPLYSRVSDRNQQRIFAAHGKTRIVLSTNVAETSLTVPGIRYVIDTGRARISRYSYRSKVQRLPVENISRASANQRQGRCGRQQDGICIRLYSEEDFLARPEFTEPEIQRSNLAGVILKMRIMGAGDMHEFPFPDPPDERYVRDGYRLLQEIGALDQQQNLTDIGRDIARLPVDPRIGRVLVAARQYHCLREMLVIASFLVVQDPRDTSADKRDRARAAHAAFEDNKSDFMTILNLWQWIHDNRAELSRRKFAALCEDMYISPLRVQEWIDLWRQLREQVSGPGIRFNTAPAGYEAIHRALMHGYISHIAIRDEEGRYQGARGRSLLIHPSSGLARTRPPWIVGAWITETSRVWVSCVAAIEPAWAAEAGAHLARREYLEPYWDAKKGQVYAYMNMILYGLTVAARRPVSFGNVDPQAARELFIRHCLVQGDCPQPPGFLQHNLAIQEKITAIEDKTRSVTETDLDSRLLDFYRQHLPAGLCSLPALRKWLQQEQEQGRDRQLRLDEQELLAGGSQQQGFPDALVWEGGTLPLVYRFEPGAEDDGVTAIIPLSMLGQLSEDIFQWLVPGLLEEKLTALIRSLPKPLRRNFVPAPQYARAVCERLQQADHGRALLPQIEAILRQMSGVSIDASAWDSERLPAHLMFNFRLVDDKGQELARGRDLGKLQQDFRAHSRRVFSSKKHWHLEGREYSAWEFGDLPETVSRSEHGSQFQAWPCIVDLQDRVCLQVRDDPEQARQLSRAGVARLFMLAGAQQARYLRRNLPHLKDLCLLLSDLVDCETLKTQLTGKTYIATFMPGAAELRREQDFHQAWEEHRAGLVPTAERLCKALFEALQTRREVNRLMDGLQQPAYEINIKDCRHQLAMLFHEDFILDTDLQQLQHYPRYLQALKIRLQKMPQRLARDAQLTDEVGALLRSYEHIHDQEEARRSCGGQLELLRWKIEELRVGLFAQELKTPVPVSVARIEKFIGKCCLQRYVG